MAGVGKKIIGLSSVSYQNEDPTPNTYSGETRLPFEPGIVPNGPVSHLSRERT